MGLALILVSCSLQENAVLSTYQVPIISSAQTKNFAELKLGEAKGTITGEGQTVQVRYAYARWVKDEFDPKERMIELLVTERAIPKQSLAFVFQDTAYKVRPSYSWAGGILRGIRFRLKKDGHYYGFGPTHMAFSVGGNDDFDEFKLEGDRVSGADEEQNLGIDNDRWSYSIRFVASLTM